MSKKPIITWLDDKGQPLSGIKFSSSAEAYEPVVADTDSKVLTVKIANNFKNGASVDEAVDDAKECQLKVSAIDGSSNSPVVKEKWLFAKNVNTDTTSHGEFTQLGGSDKAVTLAISSGNESKPNTISGGANDGNEKGSGKYNVAPVQMYLHPILQTEAEGGVNKFRITLVYAHGAE